MLRLVPPAPPPTDAAPLKSGDGDGTLPPMEARLSRVEDAILAIRSSQDRMEQRFDTFQTDLSGVKVSQARIEERMERVMDHARDIPSPDKVDSMINSKLGIAALLFAGLGALIAAITYAAS